MFLLPTALLLVVLSLLLFYVRLLHKKHNYFRERNIASPKHRFFFGHLIDIWSSQRYSKQLERWSRVHGPIYGLFEGSTPIYVVSDLDFLEEVYIKQFSLFHSRHVPFLARMGKGTHENLFGSLGDTWKRQRSIISPSLSTGKLKLMFPIIRQSIETFLEICSSSEGQEISIDKFYKRMTMDIICKSKILSVDRSSLVFFSSGKSSFGIESDMQHQHDNLYLTKSQQVVQVDFEKLLIVKLSSLFPWTKSLLARLFSMQLNLFRTISRFVPLVNRLTEELAPFWIIRQAQTIVDFRQEQSDEQTKRVDLLQMMIDARLQPKSDENQRVVSRDC